VQVSLIWQFLVALIVKGFCVQIMIVERLEDCFEYFLHAFGEVEDENRQSF